MERHQTRAHRRRTEARLIGTLMSEVGHTLEQFTYYIEKGSPDDQRALGLLIAARDALAAHYAGEDPSPLPRPAEPTTPLPSPGPACVRVTPTDPERLARVDAGLCGDCGLSARRLGSSLCEACERERAIPRPTDHGRLPPCTTCPTGYCLPGSAVCAACWGREANAQLAGGVV